MAAKLTRKRRRIRLEPAPHVESFKNNLKEIDRLLEIHQSITGEGPGYKHNVQVLNKSAIVLLLACWEAYVEDLASNCFEQLLNTATEPSDFPEFVLAIAAKELKKADTAVLWSIAKDGWRDALKSHKERILARYIERGAFNTPNDKNIDKLFSELLGLTSISNEWYWPGMSANKSVKHLSDLIELRGNIAHRLETSEKVTKTKVRDYKKLIQRMAVISHNRTCAFLYSSTKARPWMRYRYGKTN